PFDQHVRADRRALSDLDVLPDDAVGPHRDARRELRAGVYHRGRMDHRSRLVHISLLSATSASPTRACPLYFQMPRMLRSIATSSSSWSPGNTGRLKRASSIPTK